MQGELIEPFKNTIQQIYLKNAAKFNAGMDVLDQMDTYQIVQMSQQANNSASAIALDYDHLYMTSYMILKKLYVKEFCASGYF